MVKGQDENDPSAVMPAQAGVQYTAPVVIRETGNTGSSAFADDDGVCYASLI
jgi:hypothetical protein